MTASLWTGECDTEQSFEVKLWGVRGSLPSPQAENLGFGGNTACVEIRTPSQERYVFDAGSGIRNLGVEMARCGAENPPPIHLFLTHYHWDHIQGLPFFAPLFDPRRLLRIYASRAVRPPKEALSGQMMEPYFPVPLAQAASRREFEHLDFQEHRVGDLMIRPFPVQHPQGAAGYRIECDGAVIVFVPDREPGDPRLDRTIREFASNADVLIHDAQYTEAEYAQRHGWGHSTPAEAAAVAREAHVKQLVLFHHDPSHDDAQVSRMVEETRAHFPQTLGACEGRAITL
jgi:phosphoribosyl 1,2-cyclic phosphodiesterase